MTASAVSSSGECASRMPFDREVAVGDGVDDGRLAAAGQALDGELVDRAAPGGSGGGRGA